MELLELVISVTIFLSQMILLRWLFSYSDPDCDSHSPALLDLFLSFEASICSTMAFPPVGNVDHVVVSVSIDFQSNSKKDVLFHHIS